jgi:hypothetical protein
VTDLEYIKRAGDNLTEFVPTKQDLVDLANALACNITSYYYLLRICVGRSDIQMCAYAEYRLGRILDYLPELESEINEKLRRGFRENDAIQLLEMETDTSEEVDFHLRLKIRQLLSDGSIDRPETSPPVDWTNEKEQLFQKCAAHSRDCRRRLTHTILRTLLVLLKGRDPTKDAKFIEWVLELPGKHLPTEEDRASFNSMFSRLLGDENPDPTLRLWMRESVDNFGWLYAALFPLIGHQVRTPQGTGTLVRVFASECEIQQDGAGLVIRVSPLKVFRMDEQAVMAQLSRS